ADRAATVDVAATRRLPGNHAVRHVLRDDAVPRHELARWRVRFPMRPAVLMVHDAVERTDDPREVLEIFAELENLRYWAPDVDRRREADTAPCGAGMQHAAAHGAPGRISDQ